MDVDLEQEAKEKLLRLYLRCHSAEEFIEKVAIPSLCAQLSVPEIVIEVTQGE